MSEAEDYFCTCEDNNCILDLCKGECGCRGCLNAYQDFGFDD